MIEPGAMVDGSRLRLVAEAVQEHDHADRVATPRGDDPRLVGSRAHRRRDDRHRRAGGLGASAACEKGGAQRCDQKICATHTCILIRYPSRMRISGEEITGSRPLAASPLL